LKLMNPHAVALGRLGGLAGGPARARSLTPERRRSIASQAARARWSRGAPSTTNLDVAVFPGLVVKALPLRRVVASKKAAGRLKDKAVLPMLLDVIKTTERSKK